MVSHGETFRTNPDRIRNILMWKIGSTAIIAGRQPRPSCAARDMTAGGLLRSTQRAHVITRGTAAMQPDINILRPNAVNETTKRSAQESSPYFTAIDAAEVTL